jgi:hypothetical protein
MTTQEIIDEMKQLSNAERLAIVEETTRLIRQELASSVQEDTKSRLAAAANALLLDYSSDKELTAFTILDSEDFSA